MNSDWRFELIPLLEYDLNEKIIADNLMTQSQALEILKTGANVFLTGEPGSGKTHTVNAYVSWLRDHGIEPAITASTGIAATHIGGMTIHSWSGAGIKDKLDKYELNRILMSKPLVKRIGRVKVLIIDEISMLSPETLGMVETICRAVRDNSKPFGGLQIVFAGDFFQLPPVVRFNEMNSQSNLFRGSKPRFAFDSEAWAKSDPIVCYLSEQYRQDDADFLSILGAIRRGDFNSGHLRHISERRIDLVSAPSRAPKLFCHNFNVDQFNDEMLAKIPGKSQMFSMSDQGKKPLVDALKRGCISPENLRLKIGASVMFTKNNLKAGFVNGMLGLVERFDEYSEWPIVRTRNGRMIKAEPMEWGVEENGRILAKIEQVPLRLAWAITVHKSQGMSLDEAVIDLNNVFEFGQGYVALSRVRRLAGLFILGWNERAFQVHPEVFSKDGSFRESSAKAADSLAKISAGNLKKEQEKFISACEGKSQIDRSAEPPRFHSGRTKKGGIDTCAETLVLWNKGETVSRIAKSRGLKNQTILNHIEKLVKKGKIKREDLLKIIDSSLSKSLSEIHAAFQNLGDRRLSPVFQQFKGKYSYDQLQIARIFYEK